MVLISQNGDVYNFENVVCVRQQGCYIHVQKSFGAECVLAVYDTAERAKEVQADFINEMYETPFTMATRYAFPTE